MNSGIVLLRIHDFFVLQNNNMTMMKKLQPMFSITPFISSITTKSNKIWFAYRTIRFKLLEYFEVCGNKKNDILHIPHTMT